ncbi:MAG: hypothetical protein MJ120_02505 [Clostridia bacterium]|nr:hypothetical protein [Clostridia bacterium]
MKKLLAVLLVVAMIIPFASMGAFAASDSTKATWTLKASVYDAAASEADDKANFIKGGSTVYNSANTSNIEVKPGQVVWVTIHLKTGSAYYAGEFSADVFYSNSIFTSAKKANYVWNTKGRYTSLCDLQAGVPFSMITENNKKAGYPVSWSDSQKKSYEFYTAIMTPDVIAYSKTVANVDEDIVSYPIYVKKDAKNGTKGEIIIPKESLSTSTNKTGKLYLNNFVNGDLSKDSVQFSSGVTHDLSKAKITFTVVGGSSDPTPSQGGVSFFQAIINFFKAIANFFKGLFS